MESGTEIVIEPPKIYQDGQKFYRTTGGLLILHPGARIIARKPMMPPLHPYRDWPYRNLEEDLIDGH